MIKEIFKEKILGKWEKPDDICGLPPFEMRQYKGSLPPNFDPENRL